MALGFQQALGSAIERVKPDMLHLHMPSQLGAVGLDAASARKVPWVVHWHSDVVVSSISSGLLSWPACSTQAGLNKRC